MPEVTRPVDDARLKEIEKREATATPGPWWWRYPYGGDISLCCPNHGLLIVLDAVRDGMNGASIRASDRKDAMGGIMHKLKAFMVAPGKNIPDFQDVPHPDMAFLSHSRTDIPDLVAALKEARAENERLRKALRELSDGNVWSGEESLQNSGDHRRGRHCGIEDRDIVDRYDACDYGFDEGVDRSLEYVSGVARAALAGEGGR